MTQCLSVTSVTSTIKENFVDDIEVSEPDEPTKINVTSLDFRLPAKSVFKKPWTPPSKGVLVPRKTKGIPRSKNIAETLLMKLAATSQRKRNMIKEEPNSTNKTKKVQWSQCPAVCDTWDLTKWTHQDLAQHISHLKISPLQRGKWIFSLDNIGNPDRGANIWSEVCVMITKGLLPHCNACLRENQDIWVYCDCNNAIKIYNTLKETFTVSHKLTFHIIGENISIER
ncbi:unnamed protein product [Owenia fusiformis]|uniref:Uncharacterized protein n=1 Tax=Owenia fusiformis TaxID=6347 RepID=A0A8S4N562_OWEFU|nr:unnamed protein product [Owenia fusiformis]